MRVFLAISIPRFEKAEALLEEVEKIPYSKPVKTPEFHLTFRFFGEVTTKYVEMLKEDLSGVQFSKFALKVNGIGAFPSLKKANVLFLEVESLHAISENAALAAQVKPVAKDSKPFVPHITVGRFNRPADCTGLAKKYGSIAYEQEIQKITLYESTLMGTGPVYAQLKSYQLK